jgi:site-specific DNA recombinase
MKDGTKKLRFAALRRVSTEQQERVGESLRTQTKSIEEVVNELGSSVVEWYGGQEHATPGHEKKELQRLLKDAQRKPRRFDAIIVAHPDRWSRDNTASREGLEIFREHGIRFFAGNTEYDLFNPDHEMFLGISAVVGLFQARNQMKKSLQNRINRAKRGIPTGGKLPFGRRYVRTKDRQEGHWEIIPEKQKMIQECAKRYLAGESLEAVAKEHNVNHSNLNKVLTRVSGTKWQLEFTSKALNIHEIVEMKIPRLLEDDVIAAILRRSDKNRTFTHANGKDRYLFSKMVMCAHCGYAMMGQINHGKIRYYRHSRPEKRVRECQGPGVKAWVPAAELEDAIMRQLFETFGNPSAVAKAMEAAIPKDEKIQEAVKRREQVERELRKANAGLQRIIELVANDNISDADVKIQIPKAKEKIHKFEAEIASLDEQLASVPTREKIRSVSESVSKRFLRYSNGRLVAKVSDANRAFEKMTYKERRELCETVFNGKTAHGKRMGVFVSWETRKKWRWRIEGHLIEAEGLIPMSEGMKENYVFGAATHQKDLVAINARH